MKIKTTTKTVKTMRNVKYCGYCDLQSLLRYHEPRAYTCGVYGWNYDVYNVHGVTICTGYRGMPGERLERVSEYEKKARAILEANAWTVPYEETKKEIEKLLIEFCILNGGKE